MMTGNTPIFGHHHIEILGNSIVTMVYIVWMIRMYDCFRGLRMEETILNWIRWDARAWLAHSATGGRAWYAQHIHVYTQSIYSRQGLQNVILACNAYSIQRAKPRAYAKVLTVFLSVGKRAFTNNSPPLVHTSGASKIRDW